MSPDSPNVARLAVAALLGLLAASGCTEPAREERAFHHRAYPMPGFRTESHDLLLFKHPPEGRWLDLPQGHLPVAVAKHDSDVAIRIERPAGASVRGEYGFAPSAQETEPSTATFRIRLLSADGVELEKLLEARMTSGEETAFRKFEVTVAEGRTGPAYVGFDVRYESPRSKERRLSAVWVDPVIEERVALPRPPAGGAPSLLLITADTTRQDVLGPYGGEAATPALDALAADGVVLENAFSVAFGTAPSHASLFTASQAAEHGVYDNQTILSPELVTLAEAFRQQGYVTAAFVSAVPVARNLGFPQGFDLFDDLLGLDDSSGLGEFAKYERRADVTAERFLAWLEKRSGEPFFAWLHFYDPHQPYAPPGPTERDRAGLHGYFVNREGAPKHLRLPAKLRDNPRRLERVKAMARERYLAEVAHMDAQMGRVLERLKEKGLYDDTIVAFVADHGENLGEREHPLAFEHHGLFKDVTRLPLILKLPQSRHAGSRADFFLGSLDVAPTLLEIAGVEPPSQWSGRSFRRLLGKPAGRELRPHVVLEGANRQEISVRTRQWMYRRVLGEFRSQAGKLRFLGYPEDRPQELYDLMADPGETVGLDPEGHAASKRLEEILRDFAAQGAVPVERLETREHLEALKALGYVEP